MKFIFVIFLTILANNSFSQNKNNFYKWDKIVNPEDFLIGYETKLKLY